MPLVTTAIADVAMWRLMIRYVGWPFRTGLKNRSLTKWSVSKSYNSR